MTALAPAPEADSLPLCACGCGEQVRRDGLRFISGHQRNAWGKHRVQPGELDEPLTSRCAWCNTVFTGRTEDVLRDAAQHRDACTAKPTDLGPTREQKLKQMKRDQERERDRERAQSQAGRWVATRATTPGRTFESAQERHAAITEIIRDTDGLPLGDVADRLNEAGIFTTQGNLWTRHAVSAYRIKTAKAAAA